MDAVENEGVPVAKPPVSQARYTRLAIVLHWLIAALLLFEVGLGLRMEGLKGTDRFTVFQLHKSVGITILLLVLIRLVWRVMHRPPALNAKGWEKALAHGVHVLFYVLLLGLPVSGWIAVSASKLAIPTLLYGTVPWPHMPGIAALPAASKAAWQGASEFVHVNLVTLLYVLFALHVAGALKHHFVDRDGELARMVPGVRTGSWRDPRLLGVAGIAMVAALFGLNWGGAKPVPAAETAAQPVVAAASESTPLAAASSAAPEASASAEAVATEESAQEVPTWAILPGSKLGFRTRYGADPVVGSFAKFSGDIAFDPEQLDKSRVTVTVDLSSAASGDSERDSTLQGADFFATATSPRAVFRAERFRKTGAGRYVASGTLRMKGMTAALSLPFSLTITGDRATMRGSATIDRLAYKIGEGEFSSTAEIPASVTVDIAVDARRR